jgi:D-beta-D-heptose 7-phosphate kinase/D-beta-D-heptose 1-phosphate adenosyltransferase
MDKKLFFLYSDGRLIIKGVFVNRKQKGKYENILESFSKRKIMVVGDIILDRYLLGVVERISPEAPVPILRVTGEKSYLGGAANVASNLRSLGVGAELIGVVGNDSFGQQVFEGLRNGSIGSDGVFLVSGRPTTVKIRPMAGSHQLLRVDFETDENISFETEEKIIGITKEKIKQADAIIFADYRKGMLTDRVVAVIMAMAKECSVKVFVDPNIVSFEKYRGAYLVKPNKKEAEFIAKEKFTPDYSNIGELGEKLRMTFDSPLIAITLGADGMVIFENGVMQKVSTSAKEVYDVSGAGDTVISVLAAVLSLDKASFYDAGYLASLAAGIVVSRRGVATCNAQELLAMIKNE